MFKKIYSEICYLFSRLSFKIKQFAKNIVFKFKGHLLLTKRFLQHHLFNNYYLTQIGGDVVGNPQLIKAIEKMEHDMETTKSKLYKAHLFNRLSEIRAAMWTNACLSSWEVEVNYGLSIEENFLIDKDLVKVGEMTEDEYLSKSIAWLADSYAPCFEEISAEND